MRMRHTVVCGLLGYTIFFSHLIKATIFEKKNVTEQKMYMLVFSTTFM